MAQSCEVLPPCSSPGVERPEIAEAVITNLLKKGSSCWRIGILLGSHRLKDVTVGTTAEVSTCFRLEFKHDMMCSIQDLHSNAYAKAEEHIETL